MHDLVTDVELQEGTKIPFKLSLNTNRPKIKHINCEWFCKWRNDYNTMKMQLFQGYGCLKRNYGDEVVLNSLVFNQDFRVMNAQLVALNPIGRIEAPILGLNPMEDCDPTKRDPEAIINRMRDKSHGYTIDLPILRFVSQFKGNFHSEYIDGWFTMKKFTIDAFEITQNMKAKIDLHSNFIHIPSETFQLMQSELSFKERINYLFESEYATFSSNRMPKVKKLSMQFTHGPEMPLPIKYFDRYIGFTSGYYIDRVHTVFLPHSESYWTFGLQFLDHFAVSIDLEGEHIYFEPKRSNAQ